MKKFTKILKENGMEEIAKDKRLLNHFGYLFIREHPVIFESDISKFCEISKSENPKNWIKSHKLEENEPFLKNTNLFEAVQSTNWNNMRFKPSNNFNGNNSWLVEFRPLELPLTLREKSHLIFFTTVFQRIITDPKIFINFYIPISLADKNMLRSVKRKALTDQKFYFRRNFFGEKAKDVKYRTNKWSTTENIKKLQNEFFENEIVEYTIEELFLGKEDSKGKTQCMKDLFTLYIEVNKEELKVESKIRGENIILQIWESFDFFLKRSRGELYTSASLIRKFVMEHPGYKNDSVVAGETLEDLIKFCIEVQNNNHHDLLFNNL